MARIASGGIAMVACASLTWCGKPATTASGFDSSAEPRWADATAALDATSDGDAREQEPDADLIEPQDGSRADGGPADSGPDPVLVGAGDITQCESDGGLVDAMKTAAESTAKLLDAIVRDNPNLVIFTAGDNSNDLGTYAEFQNCFDPTWGRHKSLIRPTPGNHEYHTPGAPDYYRYFGDAAHPSSPGYYSYDLGAWHIVALNSALCVDETTQNSCTATGPCTTQEQWLRDDLEAHKNASCTLAYWHHPKFSTGAQGTHGSVTCMDGAWDLLYAYGAEIVVNGHDHDYEHFRPVRPDGIVDQVYGIREFVVGTGGATLDLRRAPADAGAPYGISAKYGTLFGVFKITLHSGSYEFDFVGADGGSIDHGGSTPCHGAPP